MNSPLVPASVAAGDLIYRTPPDALFVEASGLRLWDNQGREYIDAEASNGALALGYDNTILREAAAKAARLPALPSFCESELRIEVLQRLASRFDEAVGEPGRVAVELGGAQGIEMAMRIVAANRGNGTIMTFQGGYHGRSPFTAHLSASSRYRDVQPWPGPDVVRLPFPDCLSCSFRPQEGGCNPACAQSIERLGVDDVLGVSPQISCLIVEPLLNVGNCTLPDSNYLRRVVNHVRSLGGLIVVDEIFTGLHRLGPQWGFQLHDITPDIVVASKALTNGITAFSSIWARGDLASPEVFPPGSHSSTFAGNPWSLAVVDTVLDRWDSWHNVKRDLSQLEHNLGSELSALSTMGLVRKIEVVGGVAKIELAGPYAKRLRERLSRASKEQPGVLVASTGMAPATIILHPPLVADEDDIRLIVELVMQAMKELENDIED